MQKENSECNQKEKNIEWLMVIRDVSIAQSKFNEVCTSLYDLVIFEQQFPEDTAAESIDKEKKIEINSHLHLSFCHIERVIKSLQNLSYQVVKNGSLFYSINIASTDNIKFPDIELAEVLKVIKQNNHFNEVLKVLQQKITIIKENTESMHKTFEKFTRFTGQTYLSFETNEHCFETNLHNLQKNWIKFQLEFFYASQLWEMCNINEKVAKKATG